MPAMDGDTVLRCYTCGDVMFSRMFFCFHACCSYFDYPLFFRYFTQPHIIQAPAQWVKASVFAARKLDIGIETVLIS